MTVITSWLCDNCGLTADTAAGTPEGWQYVVGPMTQHVCSRECARAWLLADVDRQLDYWYPPTGYRAVVEPDPDRVSL